MFLKFSSLPRGQSFGRSISKPKLMFYRSRVKVLHHQTGKTKIKNNLIMQDFARNLTVKTLISPG